MDNSIARFQISADEDFRIQFVFVGLSLAGRTLRILVKERASNVLRTTLTLGAGLTLDGTDTVTALVPQATASAWAKGEFETDLHDITGGANTRLVGARTLYDLPGKLPYGVIGAKATVQWVVNKAIVTAIGGIGPTGPANTLTIGTVDTLPVGSPATAEITGAAPNQTLNLGIPTGDTGDTGPAGTIAVGTVTTGAPGSSVVITNVGTPENAILDFTIPEGEQGIQGLTGNKGWSPAFAIVSDGARRVLQIDDWVGGAGTKPAAGDYVGAAGLTSVIGDAIDIRGPAGTASIPDGDKGDITTSAGGDTWQINAGAVGNSELRDSAGLSVIGRAGDTNGDPADIAAGADAHVLRRSGTTLGFGQVATDGVADDAVTNTKLANMESGTFKVRRAAGTGDPEDATAEQATAMLDVVVGDSGTGGTKGLVPAPAAGDAAAGKVLGAGGGWVSQSAGLPAGARGEFWMKTAPTGWLKADGSAVSRSVYVALDTAIYCGDTDNPTADWGYRCTNPASPSSTRSTIGTHIVLPNARGEFSRGWDDGRGVDSGRSFWAEQSGAIEAHTHGLGGGSAFATGGAAFAVQSSGSSVQTGSTGGGETRPRNLVALICIKY